MLDLFNFGSDRSSDYQLLDKNFNSIPFDSMLAFSIVKEGEVVSSPIEMGTFTSYNKVHQPISIQCSLGKQFKKDLFSSESQDGFIQALDDFYNSTEVLSLVTPQMEYENMNLESYTYARSESDCATMIVCDLSLKEIREVETEVTTTKISQKSAKNPGSASKKDKGQITSATYDLNGGRII